MTDYLVANIAHFVGAALFMFACIFVIFFMLHGIKKVFQIFIILSKGG